VDLNPAALPDEWSGDRGVGALYFSQQAVNRLAPAAGLEFPAELKLPERLVKVQELVAKGHAGARRIFESIGVYLGYSVPHYADFYDFETLMVLGRVTSGSGGEILLDTARDLLRREFPAVAERVDLHVPDERSRRVGQAVAAASLPELPARKG
jgi:predicted NBD/HSP70 family sugar kinase